MEFEEYIKKHDIQKDIEKLSKKCKNKRILIYGAGSCAEYIFAHFDLSGLNIVAVSDKKFEQTNEIFWHNIKTILPEKIENIEIDLIIITNYNYDYFLKIVDKMLITTKYSNIDILPLIKTKEEFKKDKYIFTFWEPKNEIPAYIKLCMKTWKKALPDYKIVVLDYSTLFNWISPKTFDRILFRDFSPTLQTDALRCELLKAWGGSGWIRTQF